MSDYSPPSLPHIRQPVTQRCRECRFYVADADFADRGRCFLRPVKFNEGRPVVRSNDFCGQFDPAEGSTEGRIQGGAA